VHHEGGDLFALQQVRARSDFLHRVSYEAMDNVLEGMIKNGIATGFRDEWEQAWNGPKRRNGRLRSSIIISD
jgi:hypothetical protein